MQSKMFNLAMYKSIKGGTLSHLKVFITDKCGCRGPSFRTHSDYKHCSLDEVLQCIIPQAGDTPNNNQS